MAINKGISFCIFYVPQDNVLLLRELLPPMPTNFQVFNGDIKSRLLGNLCYHQCFSVTCLLELLLNGSTCLEDFQESDQLIFGH